MIFPVSREINVCFGLKPFDAASSAKKMLDDAGSSTGDASPSQNSFCHLKTSLTLGQLFKMQLANLQNQPKFLGKS